MPAAFSRRMVWMVLKASVRWWDSPFTSCGAGAGLSILTLGRRAVALTPPTAARYSVCVWERLQRSDGRSRRARRRASKRRNCMALDMFSSTGGGGGGLVEDSCCCSIQRDCWWGGVTLVSSVAVVGAGARSEGLRTCRAVDGDAAARGSDWRVCGCSRYVLMSFRIHGAGPGDRIMQGLGTTSLCLPASLVEKRPHVHVLAQPALHQHGLYIGGDYNKTLLRHLLVHAAATG